ncbi:MAG: hypothetical protein LQ349_004749 [Xanthoria aureola]|nr:MAG: hypothetical protein LQ349_004749 [Xanthoria aureola]
MEPVSLSIGAVGLMALLTTCVECFEYVDAAKTYGRNLELLTTKFAVEKARLLIWGESVGISSTNPTANNRVESPHVRPIVERILNCIRMLFEDTNALTVRYGLKYTDNEAPSSALLLAGPVDSPGLPLRLKASYVRFKSRIKLNHKQTSTTKKAKWAIRDEKKFTSLVEAIHQCIDGLENLTNSAEIATKRAALIKEELSTVVDHEDLRLIAEATTDGNQQWSDAASLALGDSVCGASSYDRVRDWMRAISGGRKSTIVDCAESAPSWDLPEASTAKSLVNLVSYMNRRLFPAQWHVKAGGPFGDPRRTKPSHQGRCNRTVGGRTLRQIIYSPRKLFLKVRGSRRVVTNTVPLSMAEKIKKAFAGERAVLFVSVSLVCGYTLLDVLKARIRGTPQKKS